jgi:predicted permease
MRYAIRSLLRQPLLALSAVATLALGIGVNSTIFTFVNAAFFKGMPGITAPGRLVWISSVWRDRGREVGMSYPDYADYREATRAVFAEVFGFRPAPLSLGSGGEPQRIRGHLVTGSYFETLGVTPAAGRLIVANDDRTGAPPTVVISHRLWRERFAASPDITTATVVVNGRQFAVIGVALEHFSGPALGEAADVWLPMALAPELRTGDKDILTNRGSSWLLVMGRLRDNATIAGARATVGAVASRLEQLYPDTNTGRLATVSSAESGLPPEGRGELMPLSALLLTVTTMVLMIACANVANLLLARGAARSLEMSIRAAIGATRRRLIRQLLTESLLLAIAGAGAGLLLSVWASDLLLARLPEGEFRGFHVVPDVRVLLFAAVLAVLSVCSFGLVPAFAATRGALLPRLRETASAGGRTRTQGAFVIAQLSLSLVLLLAGGLSLRALQKSRAIDLGFTPSGAVTASYDLELQNYSVERRIAFRRELRSHLAALPGVTAVGITNMPPLSGTMVSTVVESTDNAGGVAESRVYFNAAGSGYFEALHIAIVRGRGFADTDGPGSVRVSVVNETLARRFWGSEDPIGREVALGPTKLQVVGVVRDSKYDEATESTRPFLYTSLDQAAQLDREAVIVRTASDLAALSNALRATVHTLDPALPVFELRTLDDLLRDREDKERGISLLLGAFGALALLLASLGLYGVMSYAVTRRTHEIGVRLALGATPSQVSSLIGADALRLALVGVAVGGTLSLPMAYALGGLLFGVQIADIAAFAFICGSLIGVAIIASWIPARRAARLDPLLALRTE